jgi:exosortase
MRNKLHSLRNPAWLLSMLLAALWPHWVWMARRSVDGSDEPWGLLALATIVALLWADRHLTVRPSGRALATAAALAVCAALGGSLLPPIVAAALAMLAVVALLNGMLPPGRPRIPLAFLALLTLPLVASLNFYLGYPLRWLCGHGAAVLIGLTGWQVTAEGAALLWNGKTVLVDAPCAGIAMLWVGMYAAALLSYLYRARVLRTVVNAAAAAVIVVAANVLRNALLFFKEAGIVALPDWTHEGVGLLMFGVAFWLLFRICSWRPHAYF